MIGGVIKCVENDWDPSMELMTIVGLGFARVELEVCQFASL